MRDLVEPWNEAQQQPATYDVRLADDFYAMRRSSLPIDPHDLHDSDWERHQSLQFLLQRGQFALGRTMETITIPQDHIGYLHGKSTLGRIGLLVHATAGVLDSGWEGTVTLELRTIGHRPILLTAGMLIGQIEWRRLSDVPEQDYVQCGGRYQGQQETQLPKSLRRVG